MHYVQITGDLAEKNMTRQNGADIHNRTFVNSSKVNL